MPHYSVKVAGTLERSIVPLSSNFVAFGTLERSIVPFGVVVKIAIFTRRLGRPPRPSYGFKASEPPLGMYRSLELTRGMG